MKKQQPCDVLSIASPVVDRLIRVPHEYLEKVPGEKGGTCEIDHETLMLLRAGFEESEELIAGGAASNTIRGLARLGHSCALAGRHGNDDLGEHYLRSFDGLPVTTHFVTSTQHTAQVLCLITPDGDRTMRFFEGAAEEMGPSDLSPSLFESCRLVVLESFSFRNEGLLEKAMLLAKKAGAKVALGLSAFEIVREYRHLLHDLLPEYVDIVFANQDEAQALTGLSEEKSALALAMLCDLAVVTHGPEGCWLAEGKSAFHHDTKRVDAIDATGAGDLFMAGFLCGHLNNRSLDQCAEIGSLLGAAVTRHIGSDLPPEEWKRAKEFVQSQQ